jgi:hypothetical protein
MSLRHLRASLPVSLGLLFLAMTHSPTRCESQVPLSVPAEPILTVSKDTGAGEVVLSWSTTASPYAAVRGTSPDLLGAVFPSIIASVLAGSPYRDPVLTNGINYFYSIEDDNAATRVYSMSPASGAPGDSVTLTGLGFDTSSPGANQVFLAGTPATVTGVTDTTLTFVVPTNAWSGSVVAASANGVDGGRSFPLVVTSGLIRITSLGVDNAHTPFVADACDGTTCFGRILKFDPSTGVQTQVSDSAEGVGLPTDNSNKVYFADGRMIAGNSGTIYRTSSAGGNVYYGYCITYDVPVDEPCEPIGLGLDPSRTDFGVDGRVYVADGYSPNQRVRIVAPDPAEPTTFATGFNFGAGPRGIVVDRTSTSDFFQDVFVAESSAVKRFDSGTVPGVLQKIYNSSNSPVLSPRQMAITPLPRERLLIADDGQNRIVMINPATDKTKTIDVPFSSPRGIAVDQDASNRTFAYVAEATRVLKVPIYKTVFVAPWIASGAGIGPERVRKQIDRANNALEPCGIEIKIRNDSVNFFSAGANLDLPITNWTDPTNSCTNPLLVHTGQENAILTGQRSADPTDLNIYFVRRFTGPANLRTIAETLTEDCFSDVTDTANSGIIVSVEALNVATISGTTVQVVSDTTSVVAHEIGHALINRFLWGGGDDHANQSGTPYAPPNLMYIHSSRKVRTLDDPDQCANINQDLPDQIFRGDP